MSITRWVLLAAALLLILLPPSPDFLRSTVAIGFDPTQSESAAASTVAVVAGGLIVFLFFWRRFNEWPSDAVTPEVTDFLEAPPSYCTTWGRYQIYHVFYTGVAIALYLLIVRFPFLVDFISDVLQPPSDGRAFDEPGEEARFDLEMSTASAAGYAAAFMIGVWTSLPILGERWFRTYCHESAAVPREARNRINQFHSGKSVFSPSEDAAERLKRSEVGDFLSDCAFAPDNEDRWSFVARAEYMWMQIEAETNDRFTRARSSHAKELERLRSEIREARQQALRLIQDERRAIEELNGERGAPTAATLSRLRLDHDEAELLPDALATASIFKKDFGQRENALLERYRKIYSVLLRIMVTTTLAAFRMEKERRLQIQRLGFSLTSRPVEAIPTGVIPTSVVVGFLVIGLPTFLFWLTGDQLSASLPWLIERAGVDRFISIPAIGEQDHQTPRIVFVWPLIGALMHTLAICAAFVMVRSGADDVVEFRTRPRTPLERSDEMATGFIGGFFVNVVLMALLAVTSGRPEAIPTNGPWALVPAVTGAFLAYHLVTSAKARTHVLALALTQGAVTGGMAVALTFFLGDHVAREVQDVLVFGIYALVAAGFAGTAFGLLFPLLAGVGGHGEDLAAPTAGAEVAVVSGDGRLLSAG